MSVKYSEIFDRILKAGNFKNGAELARAINITPQAISNYKKRGEMPADLVLKFAQSYGVSIDWLLIGEGQMYKENMKQMESERSRPVIDNLPFDLGASPDEIIYIGKLLKVLRSQEKFAASSVKLSIDAFLCAMDDSRATARHHVMEDPAQKTARP